MMLKTKLTVAATAVVLAGGVTTAAAAGGPNDPAPADDARTVTATAPARVFAVINANGTKARGTAVASTKHIDTGVYEVLFHRRITNCGWSGTVGFGQNPFNGSTGPVMISVSGRSATNNGVFVQTWNGAGTPTDLPFTVVVVCS
jgi:hypothetical protein